jgi:hypothetical protein
VAGVGVPGAGVVVGPELLLGDQSCGLDGCCLHEVPEVNVLVHASKVKLLVVGRAWVM